MVGIDLGFHRAFGVAYEELIFGLFILEPGHCISGALLGRTFWVLHFAFGKIMWNSTVAGVTRIHTFVSRPFDSCRGLWALCPIIAPNYTLLYMGARPDVILGNSSFVNDRHILCNQGAL